MFATMREKSTPTTSVLDELVFVGRSGAVDGPTTPALPPVLADPEPAEAPLTPHQRVARFAVLALIAATIILVVGMGIGYAG